MFSCTAENIGENIFWINSENNVPYDTRLMLQRWFKDINNFEYPTKYNGTQDRIIKVNNSVILWLNYYIFLIFLHWFNKNNKLHFFIYFFFINKYLLFFNAT